MSDTMRIPSEAAILRWFRENPRTTAADLARAHSVAPAFVRAHLAALKGRGVLFSEGNTRGVRYFVPSAKERRAEALARKAGRP